MAIKALTLDATRSYELARDPDKGTPDATVFKLGTLDSRVVGYLRDNSTTLQYEDGVRDRVQTKMNIASVHFETVQFGLRGWSNFKDAKSSDVPFRTVKKTLGSKQYDVVAPDLLALMPLDCIYELGMEIIRVNSVSEDEAKNSGEQ